MSRASESSTEPVSAAARSRETVAALLDGSSRDHVPLRRSLVQLRQRGGGAGPLAQFVRARRARALDLYLLAHARASAPPYDVALPARVWARALGLTESTSGEMAVSKNWRWLEEHNLIVSRRRGRWREVQLLREDGSGDPYTHPGARGGGGDYFRLPYSYWEGNYQNRMGLPAKAVLLIALSLQDDFALPADRGAVWYGISRDTVRTGLRTLELLGLLRHRVERKSAPLERTGYTLERRYRLNAPFRSPPRGGPRPPDTTIL